MQSLVKCMHIGYIPMYEPGTSQYIGNLIQVMALSVRETDEDMSSIFMCTSGKEENFCFHQKVDHMGPIVPSLGLLGSSWHTIIPRGVSGGNALYYVCAWDTIPGYAYGLRGFTNMTFNGGGGVYIHVDITTYALDLTRVGDSYAYYRYSDLNFTVTYTVHDKNLAIKNSIDLSTVHKTIRYIAEAIYNASPAVIYVDRPFRNPDLESMFRSISSWVHYMMRLYPYSEYPKRRMDPNSYISLKEHPPVAEKALFNEPLRYEGYPMVGDTSNYWFNLARQRSFISACETVPKLSDNSLSNILEIANFIYNLAVKHTIKIPSSLSNAWLAYRYQYTTTRLDVEEAISFVNRHLPANIWDLGYDAKGTYTFIYKGVSVTARCSLTMRRRELDQIHKLWLSLTKYGLAPNFYVLWDMIPFSFIADWFIPVGDALNANAMGSVYTVENFEFRHIVYSLKYSLPGEYGVPYSVYYRWVEDSPPDVLGYYWFEKDSVSNKTLCKRVADVLSLLH